MKRHRNDPVLLDLYANIVANSGDMVARMAFADRLEEMGFDDWAAFCRVDSLIMKSCIRVFADNMKRKTEWHASSNDDGVVVLNRRVQSIARKIIATHKTKNQGVREVRFEKGFMATMVCTTAFWLKRGPEMVRREPLQLLYLTDKQPFKVDQQNDNHGWFCKSVASSAERHALERPLFEKMCETEKVVYPLFIRYNNRLAAYKGLSRAALAWARSEA